MGTATVAFRKCVFNIQVIQREQGYLTSRVYFDLDIDGQGYANVYVDVRGLAPLSAKDQPLEISEMYGYNGPFNFEVFCGSVEFYLSQVLGGKVSLLSSESSFLPLADWTIEQEMLVQFEVTDEEFY